MDLFKSNGSSPPDDSSPDKPGPDKPGPDKPGLWRFAPTLVLTLAAGWAGLPSWAAVLVGASVGFTIAELWSWHRNRRAGRIPPEQKREPATTAPEDLLGATHDAYHRQLYPAFHGADPPHWYAHWKTLENCRALAVQREWFRTRFEAGYEVEPADAHYTTAVTAYPTLLRDVTAQVCIRCNWASWDLRAEHGNWASASARREEE